MLLDDALIVGSLRQIVAGLTRDRELQKDLMQECLLRLWRLEEERPGCTRSWYVQGCRFHVQHFLALGRSLNSLKRSGEGNLVVIDGDEEEPALSGHHIDGAALEAASFVEILSVLSRQLKPRERCVLLGLADGMVLREIASKFGISYPTVLKYRRKIAALTIGLGISQRLVTVKQNVWQGPQFVVRGNHPAKPAN